MVAGVFLAVLLLIMGTGFTANAQDGVVVRRGDAVVTRFAGVRQPGSDLPPDVHPLDRTYIDPAGITARVLDLSRLGGGPQGQLADAPSRFELRARDIGHVFGIAFDGDGRSGPPNIYLAASSVHGLQLMAPGEDGRLVRVMTGRAGARWMDGQFGGAGQGGPGSIYRVDGRTGAVTLIANIGNAGQENSGAGLGGLAFDPRSRTLFAADLETGLVWRLALDGRVLDTYDHGTTGRAAENLPLIPYDPQGRTDRSEETFNTEIPETWGFAEPERRVNALAIENERLYYSVADGPKVWSVGLGPDGAFAADARLEIDVTGTPAGHEVTSILFDGGGTMIVAQRGARLGNYDYSAFSRPQESATLRYQWSEKEQRWGLAPDEYAIGLAAEHRGTLGGVALNYGYDRFGNIDYGRCRQTLWTTGEHLRAGSDIARVSAGGPRYVHGLQGNYKSRVRPDNEPPLEAWYIDGAGRLDDAEAYGHIGNVAIYGPCEASVELTAADVVVPVWVKGANLVVTKACRSGALGGKVHCRIVVRNAGDAIADGVLELLDATSILWGPAAGKLATTIVYAPDAADWVCAPAPAGGHLCTIPAAGFAPGAERVIDVVVDTGPLLLAGNLGIRNCVSIKHPDGQGKACAEGGSGVVVTKTGPAECLPGFGCTFQLAITNPGLSPFAGDVLISDGVFVDGKPTTAIVSSISPPLGCANEPSQLPFSCVSPTALAPGETRIHTVVVNLPVPGNYWAQNCFAATDPWLAGNPGLIAKLLLPTKAAETGKPAGAPSCTWVKVPAPGQAPAQKQQPQSGLPPAIGSNFAPGLAPLPVLPPVWSCPDGRAPLASGRCPCPLYAPFDPDTGRCTVRQACWDKVRLRPDGTCCPWGSVWWPHINGCALPPTAGCSDVWRRAADGSCCPRGTRWRNGACRPHEVATPCGFGQARNLEGICVNVGFPVPLPLIPVGVTPPRPGCPGGAARLPNGNCPAIACPGGATYDVKSGRCAPPQVTGPAKPPPKCPGLLVKSPQGACVPRGITPTLLSTIPPPKPPVVVTPPPRIATPPVVTPPVQQPPPKSAQPASGQPTTGPAAVRCPGRLVPNEKGVCVPPGIGAGAAPCPPGSARVAPNAPCRPSAAGGSGTAQPNQPNQPGLTVRPGPSTPPPLLPPVTKQPPVTQQPVVTKPPVVTKSPPVPSITKSQPSITTRPAQPQIRPVTPQQKPQTAQPVVKQAVPKRAPVVTKQRPQPPTPAKGQPAKKQ